MYIYIYIFIYIKAICKGSIHIDFYSKGWTNKFSLWSLGNKDLTSNLS